VSRRGLKQTETSSVPVRCLNRSVDKSAERREDGKLFLIQAPAKAKLRSPNVLLVRQTTNIAVSDDRSVRRPESAMSWHVQLPKVNVRRCRLSARLTICWMRSLWVTHSVFSASVQCQVATETAKPLHMSHDIVLLLTSVGVLRYLRRHWQQKTSHSAAAGTVWCCQV